MSTRSMFGEEHCYVIDAKAYGNCGRYLNVSASLIVIVEKAHIYIKQGHWKQVMITICGVKISPFSGSCSCSRSILRRPRGSHSGREKRRHESFHYGRKSPWVPTLTGPFPKIQADAGSWLGTKNALYYCAQSANTSQWVLFVCS